MLEEAREDDVELWSSAIPGGEKACGVGERLRGAAGGGGLGRVTCTAGSGCFELMMLSPANAMARGREGGPYNGSCWAC